MGVSATGARGWSLGRLATTLTTLAVVGGAGFYLYGPPVTPALNGAAASECNEVAGGSYRHYRLSWVVSARPHWLCADSREPGEPPVDLGWWVAPEL